MLAITVDTLVDELDNSILDGDISLRDAIAAAMAADTIDFKPELTAGGPATLTLTLGQLAIAKSLTINGPGANLLTIDASGSDRTPGMNEGNGTRIFNINDGNLMPDKMVTIRQLTLTGGDDSAPGLLGGGGGAIYSAEKLTVESVTITDNATTGSGGAIVSKSIFSGASLKVVDSTISVNSSGADGGGGISSAVPFEVTGSRISGNMTGGSGGGIIASVLGTITASQIRGNVAAFDGGGIAGAATIESSTISGNSALRGGGVFSLGYLSVKSSTISGNMASSNGGGILRAGGILRLAHATVAENVSLGFSGGGLYLSGGSPELFTHTIVANNTAAGPADDIAGAAVTAEYSLIEETGGVPVAGIGNIIGIDPLLEPLADNGGPTQTHALRSGSSASDTGNPAAMGGMGGVPLFDQRGDAFSRVVGTAIDIGAFEAETPNHLILVDSLDDESDNDATLGDLSLREAIEIANVTSRADTIEFAAELTADGAEEIELTLGELLITEALTILGPGEELLAIDASGNDATPDMPMGDGSRVFNIDDGDMGLIDVELLELSLTGGDVAGFGGGIRSEESLSLTDVTISENSATLKGGGIFGYESLVVTDATISGNTATGDNGGGICSFGPLTVTDSTLEGNVAENGGGIFIEFGDLLVVSSTISGNTATLPPGGGGIIGFMCSMAVISSTISGNFANESGGGVLLFVGSTLEVMHSTIAENVADADDDGAGVGGGIAALVVGPPTLGHTIVADNTAGLVAMVADDIAAMAAVLANSSLIETPVVLDAASDGNIMDEDPLLGPLADNGGLTMTHALLVGSPAINAGNMDAMAGAGGVPVFDQRGEPFSRVTSGRIDIGAVERQPIPPAVFGDYNGDGFVNAADYTVYRNMSGQIGLMPYDGADGDGDGMITRADYDVWKEHYGETVPTVGSAAVAGHALPENEQNALAAGEFTPPVAQLDKARDRPPRQGEGENPGSALIARRTRQVDALVAGPRSLTSPRRVPSDPTLFHHGGSSIHRERELNRIDFRPKQNSIERDVALLELLETPPFNERAHENFDVLAEPSDNSADEMPAAEIESVDAVFDLLAATN
jgi:hypothetical protein